jgi:polyhydroxyalkanoate synthesis regulator phasin
MRRPVDPALTSDLDESWDYNDVHANWEKENFFCPLCWEYHTMLKRRGEMFCPKQPKNCGGMPKILINRIFWHLDNLEEIMKQEPKTYRERALSWLPFMLENRQIEMSKQGKQQEQQIKQVTKRADAAESNNTKLQQKIDELQSQINNLRGQMNNGGGGVTPEAMDYLANRISWSIGDY